MKVKRPGREPENMCSAEVKNSGAVSVLTPHMPSWSVLGQLLPVTSFFFVVLSIIAYFTFCLDLC